MLKLRKYRHLNLSLLVCLGVFLGACQNRTEKQASNKVLNGTELYEKVHKASMVILVNGKESGSGAFISADGYIATAAHMLRYRDEDLEIISPQFGRMTVKFAAVDMAHDFLLLKADLTVPQDSFLRLSSQPPQPTETLYQLGSPMYRRDVFQSGKVARPDTFFEFYGDRHNHYVEIVHLSATMQSGTSGGPWINQYGEMAGIQSGTLIISESPVGIAFMSPVQKFLPTVESKLSAKSYNLDFKTTPIEAHDPLTIKRYNGYKQGLIVSDLPASSQAKEAGLDNWDLIIAVNDTPVNSVKDMMNLIIKAKKTSADLTIVELDKKKSVIKKVPVEIVEDNLVFRSIP